MEKEKDELSAPIEEIHSDTYKKRSTWMVSEEFHSKVKEIVEEEGVSIVALLNDICDGISKGKYDVFIEKEESRTKAISVYQEELGKARDYLEGSGDNVLSVVERIIRHRKIETK